MKDMLAQVEPLIPALRRYARAVVRNRSTADDLVQDCLERAVSHWHEQRGGSTRALHLAVRCGWPRKTVRRGSIGRLRHAVFVVPVEMPMALSQG